MTVDEFLEQAGSIACIYCRSTELATREKFQHIELYCISCNRHQRYLSKKKKPDVRPREPRGLLDEVWQEAKGHCAHCGLHESTLELLGVGRTMQHVPPFKVNGHDGYRIPLCDWCQQHSAGQMKRLEALVNRLSQKFNIRD